MILTELRVNILYKYTPVNRKRGQEKPLGRSMGLEEEARHVTVLFRSLSHFSFLSCM